MDSGCHLYSLWILLWLGIQSQVNTFAKEERFQVTSVAPEIREHLQLDDFYQKRVAIGNFSILGSSKVSDYALKEAAYLIAQMTSNHPEYLNKLAENKVRFSVMARDEFTTDIPEHADMSPAVFWDKRARGLGATHARPSVSCGEENLLGLKSDPYKKENILIHEFAHALHGMAINDLDPQFQTKLIHCYEQAIAEEIWKGTYAATNPSEYWAEAVQSWFDCNRANDREHGTIDTREELIQADPRIAELIEEKFGDQDWRYVHISKRFSREPHLKGFQPEKEPPFVWPKDLVEWHQKFEKGEESLAPEEAKQAIAVEDNDGLVSAFSRKRCNFFVHNLSGKPIEMHWIDFDGKLRQPRSLRHKDHTFIQSFTGHSWRIKVRNSHSSETTRFYKLPDTKHAKLVVLSP